MAHVWIRNPTACIRESVAGGCFSYVFDIAYLAKRKKIDAAKFLELHVGLQREYEWIVVRQNGAMHYNSFDPENPIGVYPVWDARYDDIGTLEAMCQRPVGEDSELCADQSAEPWQRPIWGQKHMVIVQSLPAINTNAGKRHLLTVNEIREETGADILIHGTYAFAPLVNLGFTHFDFEPRAAAAHGYAFMPNGRKVKVEESIHRHQMWVNALGSSIAQLHDPAERCIFNVKAARWAAHHGVHDYVFKTKGVSGADIDREAANETFVPALGGNALATTAVPQAGDKIECDTCSLAEQCKLYREGSVCTLDSDGKSLADLVGSRDVDDVLNGLSRIAQLSAERAEKGMAFENTFGIDPEVTKLFKQAFDFTERAAKLRHPVLRATVNLNRNQEVPAGAVEGSATLVLDSPEKAALAAIEHYEKLGFARSEITVEMTKKFILDQMGVAALPPGNGMGFEPPTQPEKSDDPVDAEVVEES